MHRTLLSISALALLLFSYTKVAAQEYSNLPDTLFFDPPAEHVHITNLDSAGAVSADLPEVNTRLVELKGDWYGSHYALAIAADGGYDLLPINASNAVDDVQLSATDVLGNGQLQVVVRTMNYMGHSGWEHSIHEREWDVEVWDLHRRQRILHLTTGQSMEEWTNYWTPDSTGLLPYEERTMLSSEGERSCETNEVQFKPKEIAVVPTDDCPDLDDQDDIPRTPRPTVHYVLGDGVWVKQ